jgi:hypothetical protein
VTPVLLAHTVLGGLEKENQIAEEGQVRDSYRLVYVGKGGWLAIPKKTCDLFIYPRYCERLKPGCVLK